MTQQNRGFTGLGCVLPFVFLHQIHVVPPSVFYISFCICLFVLGSHCTKSETNFPCFCSVLPEDLLLVSGVLHGPHIAKYNGEPGTAECL